VCSPPGGVGGDACAGPKVNTAMPRLDPWHDELSPTHTRLLLVYLGVTDTFTSELGWKSLTSKLRKRMSQISPQMASG